jgi:hypothetical protein
MLREAHGCKEITLEEKEPFVIVIAWVHGKALSSLGRWSDKHPNLAHPTNVLICVFLQIGALIPLGIFAATMERWSRMRVKGKTQNTTLSRQKSRGYPKLLSTSI